MDSGTLPPATMLLHTNDPHQQIPSADSPMNQFADAYASRPASNKTNKRKLDDFVDPASAEFESASSVKPQKTEQSDSERSSSRTGTREYHHQSQDRIHPTILSLPLCSTIQRATTLVNTIEDRQRCRPWIVRFHTTTTATDRQDDAESIATYTSNPSTTLVTSSTAATLTSTAFVLHAHVTS